MGFRFFMAQKEVAMTTAAADVSAQATNTQVTYLVAEDLKLAASLLYQSYHDDEVFMSLFQGNKPDYEKRLRAAIREELNAFWEAGQPIIGLFDGDTLKGVACVSEPGKNFGPGRYWHWRLKMLLTAGYVSTRQLLAKEQLIQEAIPHENYHMLAFIAVAPRYQQQGLGDLLIRAVNTLVVEHQDSAGVGVYVTRDFYLPLFQQHQFIVVKELEVEGVPGKLLFCSKTEALADLS